MSELTRLNGEQLREIALVLENDGAFYKSFPCAINTASSKRDAINDACTRLHRRDELGVPLPDKYSREILRRYFTARWDLSKVEGDDTFQHRACNNFWEGEPTLAETELRDHLSDVKTLVDSIDKLCSLPFTTTKEITMNAHIEITTVTLVNGADVSKMTDATIYGLIASEEGKIKELDAIQNKPKRLLAEIVKRQGGIAALVNYLDSKEV